MVFLLPTNYYLLSLITFQPQSQIQLAGKKKWHICSPSEDANLYKAGNIDTFNPDYEAYPNFREAKCFQFILSPGDVVYYPKNWWHQTKNLNTPTISITGTLALPNNYLDIQTELKKQCDGAGTIFQRDEKFCSKLENCYILWDQIFTQDKKRNKIDEL